MKRLLWLVPLLAACHFGKPITRVDIQEGLPPLPSQVPSQLGPIPIVWVDSLTDEHGRPLAGGYHSMRRTIYLRRSITSRRMQHYVAHHERCHAVLLDGGLDNIIPSAMVQAICDAFAQDRVAEMLLANKRN